MTPKKSSPSPSVSKKRKRDDTMVDEANTAESTSTSGTKKKKSKSVAPAHSSSSAASSKDIKNNIKRVNERHEASELVQNAMEFVDRFHEMNQRHVDSHLFSGGDVNGSHAEMVFELENARKLGWTHLEWDTLEEQKRKRQQQVMREQEAAEENGSDTATKKTTGTAQIATSSQQNHSGFTPMSGFPVQEPIKTHEINTLLPASVLSDPSVLRDIFTSETLRQKLTEDERMFLARYLPPDVNLYTVFDNCSKLGENQVDRFVENVTNGELHPLIYQQKMHLRFLKSQQNKLHKAMVENYIKAEIHEKYGAPSQNEMDDRMVDDDEEG